MYVHLFSGKFNILNCYPFIMGDFYFLTAIIVVYNLELTHDLYLDYIMY